MAGAVRDVSGAVPNSVLAVERTVLVLIRSGRRLPLHVVAAFYVVSEQRRSHLGHETVRQVSEFIHLFFFFNFENSKGRVDFTTMVFFFCDQAPIDRIRSLRVSRQRL